MAGGFGCVLHLTVSQDTGTVVASGKQENINTGIIKVHLHSHFDLLWFILASHLFSSMQQQETIITQSVQRKKKKTEDGLILFLLSMSKSR